MKRKREAVFAEWTAAPSEVREELVSLLGKLRNRAVTLVVGVNAVTRCLTAAAEPSDEDSADAASHPAAAPLRVVIASRDVRPPLIVEPALELARRRGVDVVLLPAASGALAKALGAGRRVACLGVRRRAAEDALERAGDTEQHAEQVDALCAYASHWRSTHAPRAEHERLWRVAEGADPPAGGAKHARS